MLSVQPAGYSQYDLTVDCGAGETRLSTDCANIHADDFIAVDTAAMTVCTPDDLHAQPAEFPHCITDGILILNEDCKPGDDIKKVLGLDEWVADFEIHPTGRTA